MPAAQEVWHAGGTYTLPEPDIHRTNLPRRAFTLSTFTSPIRLPCLNFSSPSLVDARSHAFRALQLPPCILFRSPPFHRTPWTPCTRLVASLLAPCDLVGTTLSSNAHTSPLRDTPKVTSCDTLSSAELASGDRLKPDVLMEDDEYATSKMEGIRLEDGPTNGVHHGSGSPAAISKLESRGDEAQSPALSHDGSKSRSGSAETPNSQKPPKLSRKASQKNEQPSREPVIYRDLPDVTEDSCKTFQVIPDCLYGSKHLGATDNDAFDCDCNPEWRKLPTI